MVTAFCCFFMFLNDLLRTEIHFRSILTALVQLICAWFDFVYDQSKAIDNTHKLFAQTSFPTVWEEIETIKLFHYWSIWYTIRKMIPKLLLFAFCVAITSFYTRRIQEKTITATTMRMTLFPSLSLPTPKTYSLNRRKSLDLKSYEYFRISLSLSRSFSPSCNRISLYLAFFSLFRIISLSLYCETMRKTT